MGLVDAPEILVVVLPAVKPVNVEVVHHEEEQHLQAERPAREQMESRQAGRLVDERDYSREDDEAQDRALHQRVEDEIIEESSPEEGLTAVVGKAPFERDEHHRGDHDDQLRNDCCRHPKWVAALAAFSSRRWCSWSGRWSER